VDERKGAVVRVLGLVERLFELVERAWAFLIVGGLFAGAVVFGVVYLIRGGAERSDSAPPGLIGARVRRGA